jgi:hypothetical protein
VEPAFFEEEVGRAMKKNLRNLRTFLCMCVLGVSLEGNAQDQDRAGFRLIYLISVETDKLKVGGMATVEPMFLTNGSKLIFLYDYCRFFADRKEGEASEFIDHKIEDREIADDLSIVTGYCRNKSMTIPAKDYFVQGSNGITLAINSFLTQPGKSGVYRPPIFPIEGVAAITKLGGQRIVGVEKTANEPQHFFWISSSLRMLEQIARRPRAPIDQVQSLLSKVKKYSAAVEEGGMKAPDSSCVNRRELDYLERVKGQVRPEGLRLVGASLGDLDGDGAVDLTATIEFLVRRSRKDYVVDFTGRELRIFYGSGEEKCISRSEERPASMPNGHIKVSGCTYISTSFTGGGLSRDVVVVPKETETCRNMTTSKKIEEVD